MALLVLQMMLSSLDPRIEMDPYLPSMPRVGKFYGPIKLEPVSMEACQLAMGAYMWVMDIVFGDLISLTFPVESGSLASVLSSKNLCG